MRTNPDYCFGLPGGLWREPHILAAPNIEPNGHGIVLQCVRGRSSVITPASFPPHRLSRGVLSFVAYCPIEIGGHASARRRGCNWFLAVADGPKRVGPDVPTSRP